MTEKTTTKPDWDALAQRPLFYELLKSKTRFLVPSVIFFLVYYFSLLILNGYFPELMKKPILGKVNGAYLFALSQFFMSWILAFIYVKVAKHWDERAAQVIKDQN
jgi:uncharacterized membrane protein (DUF485 family)